ncbi:AMP-binding protein [Bacteroidota bacterium]
MKRFEPYILNNKKYPHDEFLEFLKTKLESSETKSYELKLYRFILDFFDEKVELEQFTSGTTGEPKRFVLRREAMISSAERTIEYFNLSSGNSILLCLPVNYIAGKMVVVRALVGGLNLITVEPKGNPLEGLTDPIDFVAMVPLQVFEAIKNPKSFRRIRTLIIGGGEIRPQIRAKIRTIKDCKIYESFALTETYTHFAIRRLNGFLPEHSFTAMKDVQIDTDERGCLLVNIPGVTEEYVICNDMVEIVDNQHFRWLGRFDNIINSGGIKIIPEELEIKIQGILGIAVILIGIPDEKLGQKLVLVAECSDENADKSHWKEKLKSSLLKHEFPREFFCIRQFPRNKSMKLSRIELRKWVIEAHSND